jgi:hypothetical protein
METDNFFLPTEQEIQKHIISSLSQYWKNKSYLIEKLPIKRTITNVMPGTPLKLVSILLPDWAKHCGVSNRLLVPAECNPKKYYGNKSDLWMEIDWFLAIFLMLECWHERLWENKFGPIHSYSFKLKGWDKRAWERAWVNRIGLFLREWAAYTKKKSPESLFGIRNKAKIKVTHDVDAVKKTWAIRFKKSVFMLFNAFRAVFKGNFLLALEKIKKSFFFFINNEDWIVFDKLLAYEKDTNITSTFYLYSDLKKKKLKNMLFDPGYKINSKSLKKILSDISLNNHEIGLHPGFDSWNSIEDLREQKQSLEDACGISISSVRQHWLRFSWKFTWACQQAVGLKLDTTLMFNDRPGFRNSSSLLWHPWNFSKKKAYNIQAMPSILMDSHIYDYLELNDHERENLMYHLVKECKTVSGEAAVLWHPHTLTKDYGWSDSFLKFLRMINK